MDLYRNLQRHYPKPEPYITEVVRRGHWKLNARDGVAQELFDLATDPMETTNLLKQQTTLATAMVEDLRALPCCRSRPQRLAAWQLVRR
jgi:arylsulfatase A